MNVLSLFDGMSCGHIALSKLGIKVDNYYACEIDKHAIAVTQHNFPDTIQLGDITKIKAEDLPKIDLLIGGSPCQGFSFAGKQLNFEDPRSKLFFEYVRILNEVKPKYFLLENVKMRKEYQAVITEYLKVEPIEINSSLQSPQHRRRLYWTNIPNVSLPVDNGVTLESMLEKGIGGVLVDFKGKDKLTLIARNGKNIILESKFKPPYTIYENRTEEGKRARKELRKLLGRDTTPRGVAHKEYRISPKDKANCLVTVNSELNCVVDMENYYRELTPIEMERLQTVPDNYTEIASKNQRRKMLGNGWTVDIIAHIFKNMA